MLGIAGQLPGKNVIYHAYIHPVLWIGCVVIVRRSKCLSLSLCLIGIGTLAPGGVLVCAGLRWGSFRGKDSAHGDWLLRLWGRSG